MLRHSLLPAPLLGATTGLAELCIAVVHASDAVLCVVAGRNRTDVMPTLAEWVAEQAPLQLWEEDAETLNTLVTGGDVEGAVRFYFDALEGPRCRIRWERQWLFIQTVSVADEVDVPD